MVLETKEQTTAKEPWLQNVFEELDSFCKDFEEKINKEQQQLKACKKNNELETKLAQEIKINQELTQKVTEVNQRCKDIERACALAKSSLKITESDQKRLDNARDMYQIGKEITGIRFDFSAPPNVAKGYIKNESCKILQPFELDSNDTEGLWSLLEQASSPFWQTIADKENKPHN